MWEKNSGSKKKSQGKLENILETMENESTAYQNYGNLGKQC